MAVISIIASPARPPAARVFYVRNFKEKLMPTVGTGKKKKRFAYSEAGKKKAKAYAKKTGKKVKKVKRKAYS